jgi:hypothetical protein
MNCTCGSKIIAEADLDTERLVGRCIACNEALRPWPRNREDRQPAFERGMASRSDLPEGKTCGDCASSDRCCQIFARIPADQVCDWSPSRFQPRGA